MEEEDYDHLSSVMDRLNQLAYKMNDARCRGDVEHVVHIQKVRANFERLDQLSSKEEIERKLQDLMMADVVNQEKERFKLEEVLESKDFLPPDHPLFWHGRSFGSYDDSYLRPPKVTWESPDKPRDDHNHDDLNWLTASEYEDDETIMDLKLQKLAKLLLLSKKTVVYSGAGISVAAGIGQASRGSKRSHPHFKTRSTAALPTKTHYALCALAKHGLIHGWVQQNHDGLPQKAGFPQECINEIHGSWYNPSNPVVLYSGSLRSHEFAWMNEEANTADLVLVLGTSLSGLNADKVAINTARRSLQKKALGVVMINLQQTPHDGKASLRIFGSSDDVFESLFSHMSNLSMPRMEPKVFPFAAASSEMSQRKFLIPYNKQGLCTGKKKSMYLDLNVGAKVQITNHNIAGAAQPSHQSMIQHSKDPIGQVVGWDDTVMAIKICMQPRQNVMLLGYWWVEAAINGKTPTIPIVNIDPRFSSS